MEIGMVARPRTSWSHKQNYDGEVRPAGAAANPGVKKPSMHQERRPNQCQDAGDASRDNGKHLLGAVADAQGVEKLDGGQQSDQVSRQI